MVEIISGFEGKDVEAFIKKASEIWGQGGTKPRGAQMRYQIIIGRVNQRAAFVPTVSTRGGVETLIIWNLEQEDVRKIEEAAREIGLPVSSRPHLWLGELPTNLPNESRK